jgi:predicted acetyltransferase
MDPSLTLRTLRDDEFLAYGRAMERVFLEHSDDDELERWRPVCPPDRFLAVTDPDGGYVGTAGSHPLAISWPGSAQPLRCAAVTGVTVRPDHRRRGVLRAMMQRLLDDAVAAGEPVAALFASEGTIYGRFGFGPSAPAHGLRITRDALATVDGDPGLVRLVDAEEAKAAFPAIATAHGRLRPGAVQRDDAWYVLWLDHHQEKGRDGTSGARWHGLVPGRGYVTFRGVDGQWSDRRPDGVLRVEELMALDDEAAAALWSFVAGVDLVRTVEAPYRPVDDPVRFLVANEAEVDVKAGMPLWLRLVDLPAALAARRYAVADRLVLDVRDAQVPANDGRWALQAGPDGAACTPTTDPADVTLSTSTLSTLALGGFRATTLADAGRLPGTGPHVVRRLDLLFDVPRAPWTAFNF